MKWGRWFAIATVGMVSFANAHVNQVYDPDDLERLLKTDLDFQEVYDHLTPEQLSKGASWAVDALGIDARVLTEKRLLIAGALYTEYLRYGKTKKIAAELILQARAYFPLFDKIFSRTGGSASSAIQFLAWIESRFNPKIVSPAKAVGMWQFIAETARSEGLIVSKSVDQRTNVYASTFGAAKHTGSLYDENQLSSWDGVMIAYNAGPGRLRQILRDNQCENNRDTYLCGYDDLRPETQMYIPRLLAAAYIFTMHEEYGIGALIEGYERVDFFPQCLTLEDHPKNVNLIDLSRTRKIPDAQLTYFNSGLNRTPDNNGNIVLTIPHPMQTVEFAGKTYRTCDAEGLMNTLRAQMQRETPATLPILMPTRVDSIQSKPLPTRSLDYTRPRRRG